MASAATTGQRAQRTPLPHHPASVQVPSDPLLAMTKQFLLRSARGIPPGDGLTRCWREFYRRYDAILRRRAAGYRLPPADIRDCLQETWREIITRIPAFCDRGHSRACQRWVTRILHAKVADLLRARGRRAAAVSRYTVHLRARKGHCQVAPTDQPEEETLLVLRLALEQLRAQIPGHSYQLFRARWLAERSVAEIATDHQLPPCHVSYVICRVKQRLAALYRQIERQRSHGR